MFTRVSRFFSNVRAMPGRVETVARQSSRLSRLEQKIDALAERVAQEQLAPSTPQANGNGFLLTEGAALQTSLPAADKSVLHELVPTISDRSMNSDFLSADIGSAKAEFIEHLSELLERPFAGDTYTCRCCGEAIDLGSLEPRDATCVVSNLTLSRYSCPSCSVIFGPVQLIECSAEDLGRLYELLYDFLHEGDSQIGQEKAFYCTNPGFGERFLNYACGDWDRGLAHLRGIGWNIEGYEPFQNNTSPHIFTHSEDVPKHAYDCVFSHNYLEHVQDPIAFFNECREYIAPGGRMGHSTPCFKYIYEQSPVHLHFVLPEAVIALADKTGFIVSGHFSSDRESEHLNIQFECYMFSPKAETV